MIPLEKLPYIMPYQDLVLFCLGFCLLILAIKFGNRRRNYLKKNGIPSSANIISINKTLVTIGGDNSPGRPVMKIVLGIEVAGSEYRQVTVKQDFGTWEIPKEGDKVNVLIDPRNPDKLLIVDIVQD